MMATRATPNRLVTQHKFNETEIGSIMTLPRSLHEAYQLHLKRIDHPAVKLFSSSLQAHRSCNEAILFLYGVSGAGKSSTLNHLFSTDLIPTSATKSATDCVTEWVSSMHSEDWCVSNLEVGFVDVPGWGDSEGRDATNFALMQQFLSVHPILGCKLRKFYPNIVLLVFSSNDNRMLGSEANALRMITCLSKLDIVDKKRPNVVIVLTHVCSHPRVGFAEKMGEQSVIYQNIARACLGVNPPVVWMENNPKYELERRGDWTLLYDGTEQPLNLYEAIRNLMDTAGDEIGKEAVRLYFAPSKVIHLPKERLRINSMYNVDSHKRMTKKWVEEIGKVAPKFSNTELNLYLLQLVAGNPDFCLCRENISELLIALEKSGIRKIVDLTSLTIIQLEIMIKPFLLSYQEKLLFLRSSLIKPLSLSQSIFTIGNGYNLDTNKLCVAPIFEWTCNEVFNQFFFNFLSEAVSVTAIQGTRLTFGNVAMDSIASSQLTEAIEQLNKCLSHNSLQESRCLAIQLLEQKSSQLSELLFRVELSRVCLKLNLESVRFTSEFMSTISSLPHQCISDLTKQLVPEYTEFFNQYGHFVLLQADGGGAIEGCYSVTNEEMSCFDTLSTIHKLIELYLDLIQEGYQWRSLSNELTPEEREIMEKLDTTPVVWLAGDLTATSNTLEGLSRDKYSKWFESLTEDFILLDSSLSFIPIYMLVDRIDSIIGVELKLAFEVTHPRGKRLVSEYNLDLSSIGSRFILEFDSQTCSAVTNIHSQSIPDSLKRYKLRTKIHSTT